MLKIQKKQEIEEPMKETPKNKDSWLGHFSQAHAYTLDTLGLFTYKGFLNGQQVDYINKLISNHIGGLKPPPSKFNFFELDPIFAEIISRPWIVDACRATLGDQYRLDHVVGIQQPGQIRSAKTGEWVDQGYIYGNIHGGWHSSQGSCYYHSTESKIASGHMTVGIFLTDQNVKTGGFCYIPGSHKQANSSNGANIFREILKGDYDHQCIRLPTLNKGDLVFFPECLMHGTTPLKVQHQRRAIYFKFVPGFSTWRDYKEVANFSSMATTELQKKILRPAYCANINDEAGRMGDNHYKKPTV